MACKGEQAKGVTCLDLNAYRDVALSKPLSPQALKAARSVEGK